MAIEVEALRRGDEMKATVNNLAEAMLLVSQLAAEDWTVLVWKKQE